MPRAFEVLQVSSDRAAAVRNIPGLQRVPDVVGLIYYEAESVLNGAGYEPALTLLDEPDTSVALGHVAATAPPAGLVQAGGVVEVKIPRAASDVGIGALSVSDIERRDGFDLDTLRYEQILRGADIILTKHPDVLHPATEKSGAYYDGGGVYVDASDGALVTDLRDDIHTVQQFGLASYMTYAACVTALKARPIAIEVDRTLHNAGAIVGCIRTSKRQVAAISFMSADNPGGVKDYKFRIALFPRQLSVKRPSSVLLPVKP